MNFVLPFFLILMVLFAILSIEAKMLRNAVIFLGVFSMISAVIYLLYQSPDVALAEAIIGSTLTVILYLVALQKYRIITVYYTNELKESEIAQTILHPLPIIRRLREFCVSRRFELNVVQTSQSLEELKAEASHDLIIRQTAEGTCIYANREKILYEELEEFMVAEDPEHICFTYFVHERGVHR